MTKTIPSVDFMFREDGQFVAKSTEDLFSAKRVVVFSLPGAFTPTCSAYQLPGFEEKFDEFVSLGVDAVYCISVNDAFVMNAWGKDQGIKNVQLIPDGNGEFTNGMGMLVKKFNLGFAMRSWRYAALVNNGEIIKLFEEPGKCNNAEEDPYGETTPEKVLEYLKTIV
jgi:peroxiredoxin